MQQLFRRWRDRGGPEAALAEIDALLSAGRYRAAISRLTAENRRRPDAAQEARLVTLRHEGYHAEPAPPRPAGPAVVPPDPFPSTRGVPEISARELDAAVLAGAIAHHGALIVRGLVSAARAATLVDDIDGALAAYDATVAGRGTAADPRWFTPFPLRPEYTYSEIDRRWGRDSGGSLLVADSPRALYDLIETFTEIGVGEHLAGFLGEWPALSFKKSTLRRTPPTTATEWHQDGSFLGRDTRTVNIWLACTHCGVDAPSIDLVARRIDHLVETGTGGAAFAWSVGHEVGDRVGGDDVVRPEFAPGDALLIDHLTLHRTGVGPGMTRTRYAIESWFFAPSTYPLEQVPVLF